MQFKKSEIFKRRKKKESKTGTTNHPIYIYIFLFLQNLIYDIIRYKFCIYYLHLMHYGNELSQIV